MPILTVQPVNDVDVFEVSGHTSDQEEGFHDEYVGEDTEDQDDNLDINARDLLKTIILQNVETYADNVHEHMDEKENKDGNSSSIGALLLFLFNERIIIQFIIISSLLYHIHNPIGNLNYAALS